MSTHEVKTSAICIDCGATVAIPDEEYVYGSQAYCLNGHGVMFLVHDCKFCGKELAYTIGDPYESVEEIVCSDCVAKVRQKALDTRIQRARHESASG